MYWALLVVFGIFALGDYLGVVSKARLSSVFVALMCFLVLFLSGVLPQDLIKIAGLTDLAKMATPFLVFSMGSSINLSQMRREWKVVVMSLAAMLVAVVSVLAVAPLIGMQSALVCIPIVNGGIVATQIMTAAALEKGFGLAAALGTLVFAVQKFVGTIPASHFGLKEAKLLVSDYREKKAQGIDLLKAAQPQTREETDAQPKKVPFCVRYDKYYTVYMTLGIAAAVAYVSSLIARVTGIAASIWCLLFGMLLNQLHLIPSRILDRGKSSGLFMTATFCSLIPALAKIKLSDMGSMAVSLALVFGAVLIGTFLLLYVLPLWKFIGSRNMVVGIAMSQLLGFPATFLIVNEVATAVARNDDEKNYVVEKLTPAFVVSGFVSVTTFSIIMAGIFASFLHLFPAP
ncbi:hypothetical protein [Pyramidobacter sp.]|uniref:hypothetical protein n=1 Tax=Pyramidobacter sp. TaxID=1943581 RepID=UPI00332DB796